MKENEKIKDTDIIVCVINPDYIPVKQTNWAFAYDLKAREKVVINPWEVKIVKTWVKVKLPKWVWMLVFSRSSLPMKKHLIVANWVWIVDCDYRWEVWIVLMNIWIEPTIVLPWERLWQTVFQAELWVDMRDTDIVIETEWFETFEQDYPTERWEGWFWSTWK